MVIHPMHTLVLDISIRFNNPICECLGFILGLEYIKLDNKVKIVTHDTPLHGMLLLSSYHICMVESG